MSHKATNWAIEPTKKRAKWLWDKTDGHCAYCGLLFSSPDEMTVDHAIARARGGAHDRSNMFPCCRACNATKGSRPLGYLRDALQRRQNGRPTFTLEQVEYLQRQGFDFPQEPAFRFYWEMIGNSFEGMSG